MFFARPDPTTALAPTRTRILAHIVLGAGAAAQDKAQDKAPAAPLPVQQTPHAPQAPVAAPLAPPPEAPSQAIAYTVRIDAPRNLRSLLEDNLDLMRWRGNPRLDLEQLQRLVRTTPDEVKTLIATEGYYSPQVSAGIDTSGEKPVVRIIVEPGQPVTVADIDIALEGFAAPATGGAAFDKDAAPFDAAALRNRWTLPAGSRFRTADWEAAKRGLVRQIALARFPRARLVDSSATVDPESRRVQLKVVIDSGPDVHLGGLKIEGLKRYPASIVNNLNEIRPGEEYSEAALQAFQGRLQETGYFSTVEVSADMSSVLDEQIDAIKQDQNGQASAAGAAAANAAAGPTTLPVLVRVTENKRKNVSVGLGISTNTGARAQAEYDDLFVFGKRMKSNLIYETKHQAANVDFFWPTTSNGYRNSVGAGYDRLNANGQITRTTSVHATRAWGSPLLERSLRLEALTEQITIDDLAPTRVKSVPLTFAITKRSLDSLVLPTRGYIVNAQLGAAVLPVLTDERFVRAYIRGLGYKPLGDKGTLIVRGEFGAVGSKDKAGVPSTFLFRAGGDQSVRGYGYQQLGVPVRDAITGGRYLLTASAEYDYWFKPPWGAAVFYDVGNAADNFKDLKPKVGYGVGARWRSPVGPINVDVAYGKAVHKVRLHFSLGFTF
jgi:translocation and assembly module TamA